MEATCSTCPYYSADGHCHEAKAILAADIPAARPASYWCSAHPLRQRDRLAAMAMQGVLATQSVLAAVTGPAARSMSPAAVAEESYALADEMLAAAARALQVRDHQSDQEVAPCGS